jgi:hypothetical protein
VEQVTALVVERLIEGTVAQAKAQVSPELALLIGGDVAGLKDRVQGELDKLKGQAQTELDALKVKAKGQLQQQLGDQVGDILEGDSAEKLKEAIGDKANQVLEKGADAVMEGDTNETLKTETDKALESGSKKVRNKLGGLLEEKKKD